MLTAIGFSTRALVQCAHRERLAIRSYDCCGDRDTRELAFDTKVIDLNDPCWIETLTPSERVMLAGGLEDNATALELLSRVDNTIVPEQYLQMRNWKNWQRWALESGLNFPSTHTPEEWLRRQVSPTVDPNAEVKQPGRRWLWKKHRSAGGLGVKFVDSNELKEPSQLRANDLSELGLLQEYVSGKSIGVSFLSSHHGTLIVGMSESIPLQPHIWSDFIYRGSIAPISIPKSIETPLSDFANSVVRSTEWRGIWQADFVLNGDALYLLEINPRWTASMELLAHGYDLPLVSWHVECRQFDRVTWQGAKSHLEKVQLGLPSKFRKEIRYAEEDGFVSAEEADDWWKRRWIARQAESNGLWYADIPMVHATLTKGAPVYSVIEQVD